LVQQEVCAISGKLPTPLCPYTRSEWFIEGTQPDQSDTTYQQVILDSATGRLADESTPPERRMTAIALDLPASAQPWARARGMLLLADLAAGSAGMEFESAIVLLTPHDQTTFHLASDFEQQAQQLLVEAAARAGFARIMLVVDGMTLATLEAPPYQAWWPLAEGTHRFWAEGVSEDGSVVRSTVVEIVVEKE
jgi:hypothetical protein